MADVAADRYAVSSDFLKDREVQTTIARRSLAHAVEVAVALAPFAKAKQQEGKEVFPTEGKEEKLDALLVPRAIHSLGLSSVINVSFKSLITKPCLTSRPYWRVDVWAWLLERILVSTRLSLLT